jgi:hypothetical protein
MSEEGDSMPIDDEESTRWLSIAMLVLGLVACGSAPLARPSGGSDGGQSVGGVNGGGGLGGSGGLVGTPTDAGADGSGPTFDPSAGPCGQNVYDLASKCPDGCRLSGVPDCPTPSDLHPVHLSIGCGYLIITQAIGEGDAVSETYDLGTNKLLYYSSLGSVAIGCAVRGTRFGQAPTCSKWTDLCAGAGSGGQGGAGR